ncbi:MAG: hypothetical protein QG592_1370 [Pseudomonadota bacterium]|jgi:hypothetical protein|nr:hypothetical protein [Pseudomonadota bacterium]
MSDSLAASPAPEPVVPGPALNIPAEALSEQPAPSQDANSAPPEAPKKEGETADDPKPEKPKRPASERISELYARTKAAERERDLAYAELQRLRQPVITQEQYDQLPFNQQQQIDVRAAVREERAADLEREAERRHQEAQFMRAQQHRERLDAAAESIPDLMDKLNDPTLPISEYAAHLIAESEKGPQMAYWLANNRAEAQRISRLHPTQQAYELGKIEARINAAPQARKVSQAPAPVPTVGGGGNTGSKDPRAMSMDEYAAWRRAGK